MSNGEYYITAMNVKKIPINLYTTFVVLWTIFTSRWKIGKNVFEDDWDFLIILDACRIDALQEVESEYEFLSDIDEVWSRGSTSKEWMERTFVEEYRTSIESTAYVTANGFSHQLFDKGDHLSYGTTKGTVFEGSEFANNLVRDDVVGGEDFGHIEPMWGSSDVEDAFQPTQHPEEMTDRAIAAARKEEWDKIVVHYMQPHAPYFASSRNYDDLRDFEQHPFEALKQGKDFEEIWSAYVDNLRYVLDSVERLLKNVDGEVVITADHGEMFGEMGLYAHKAGILHPKLRKVPWVRTEAENVQDSVPKVELQGESGVESVTEEQLEALGYV